MRKRATHCLRPHTENFTAWLTRGFETGGAIRSFRQHESDLVSIKYDSLIGPLRDDPRYKALLRKMNLPGGLQSAAGSFFRHSLFGPCAISRVTVYNQAATYINQADVAP
jgi:hypothetical protein